MKLKFDYNLFKDWFDLNNMSRNRVLKILGQRDPNKVGRWLTGQVIATKDLIGLCNHYNLEPSDFLIMSEEENARIKTVLPDRLKKKREMEMRKWNEIASTTRDDTVQVSKKQAASDSLSTLDIALAKQSIMYEKRINELITSHSLEIKENNANTRQQLRERNKIIETLQDTIAILNKEVETKQKSEEALQEAISALRQTITEQQATISSYDAIIRKQKKIPSQPSPFYSGQATMVNDGGAGAVTATTPQHND